MRATVGQGEHRAPSFGGLHMLLEVVSCAWELRSGTHEWIRCLSRSFEFCENRAQAFMADLPALSRGPVHRLSQSLRERSKPCCTPNPGSRPKMRWVVSYCSCENVATLGKTLHVPYLAVDCVSRPSKVRAVQSTTSPLALLVSRVRDAISAT